MGKYVELTDQNFDMNTAKGLTLVDFWAPWCGPCRMVAPTIEKLAEEFDGKVQVAKLNVDDNQVSAMKFRVMSIPTVILFKDGQPAEMFVGADVSGNRYRQMIAKHLPVASAN